MNNIISFQEAKARRDKAKLITEAASISTEKDRPKMTVMKSLISMATKENLFIKEARRFKFTRMQNCPSFVVMNTKILPEPFPPVNPPPLVA